MLGLGTAILVHLLVVYALVTGLARKAVEAVRGPLETRLIEEVKVPEPPKKAEPPPPKTDTPPPPAYVPPAEVRPPPSAAAPTITAVTRDAPPAEAPPPPPAPVAAPAPAPEPPAPKPVVRQPASLIGCPRPDYPAVSRRMEEQGTVVLRLTIDTEGKVSDAKVETSSSYSRLDEAARAAMSRCTFKPATADGKPETGSATQRYTFKLEID